MAAPMPSRSTPIRLPFALPRERDSSPPRRGLSTRIMATSRHFAGSNRPNVNQGIPFSEGAPGHVLHTNTVLAEHHQDRKSTRLNSSHLVISYAVFCLKKKTTCVQISR